MHIVVKSEKAGSAVGLELHSRLFRLKPIKSLFIVHNFILGFLD